MQHIESQANRLTLDQKLSILDKLETAASKDPSLNKTLSDALQWPPRPVHADAPTRQYLIHLLGKPFEFIGKIGKVYLQSMAITLSIYAILFSLAMGIAFWPNIVAWTKTKKTKLSQRMKSIMDKFRKNPTQPPIVVPLETPQ